MVYRTGISLGTNLGDRLENLRKSRDLLLDLVPPGTAYQQSAIYRTEPLNCPPNSSDFYNAVIEIGYGGKPQDLLKATQQIERTLGRHTSALRNAPRPIDLDILYYGQTEIDEEILTIPHPRLTVRRFVLRPLADINSRLTLPGDIITVGEHLRKLDSEESEPTLIQTLW